MQAPPAGNRAGGIGPSCRRARAVGPRCAPRRNLRSTIWQMVEYKRATLRDEDALETPVEGGASPDAVEVRRVPPPFSLPPMT